MPQPHVREFAAESAVHNDVAAFEVSVNFELTCMYVTQALQVEPTIIAF